jgi:ABC-type multidrug transport system permease subunit
MLAGAGEQVIASECVDPGATMNPPSGAWTNAASHPGSAVMLPTTTALALTFPLVFAASTFTSTDTMPGWVRAFAEAQPVTHVVDALRALTQGTGPAAHSALAALAWSAGILIVAATLAVRRFRTI